MIPLVIASALLCCARPALASSTATVDNPRAVKAYARVLHRINPQLPAWQSRELALHLLVNANRWKIDANMLAAIVTVESAWHTRARSWAGAMGLGQLMPGTARTLRVNPHDPYQNLQGAARYLHRMLMTFASSAQRYALAFAAYNAGPKAVEEFGGIPPFAETQHYVVKVMRTWRHLSAVVHIPKVSAKSAIAKETSPEVDYWTR